MTRSSVSRTDEHRFFTGVSVAILAMAVVGFMRTYLLVPQLGLPEGALEFTPLVHVHAALSFGWCVLFIVQCWLVASGRSAQHRELGRFGVAMYGCLVVLGPFVAIHSTARNGSTPDELAFLAVSMGNITVTQRDLHGIVAGSGMATRDGGSVQSWHLGQVRGGVNIECPDGSHMAFYDDQQTYFSGLIRFISDVDDAKL